jgi:uncharacterized protein (TIGR02246 family)
LKVAVFVKATRSSEAGTLPSEQLLTDMGKYNEALVNAGIMKSGEGLKPSSQGVRVRFSGANRTVTDGPFAETNELVAGFWMWEVASMQEAIDWVKKCPNPMDDDSDIEIRPCFGLDDFAPVDPTGQLRGEEQALAERISHMSEDEAAIRRVIARWSAALEAKDLDGLVADYADDAVLFDAIPPYKTVGKGAIRQVWANCLPYFPAKFKSEHRDIVIHVSGDTAVMYGLHHFIPEPADHPSGQTWLRVTVGYRRINGQWKSVHDHISIPFNPMNNQAWMIRDPDMVDMPDYVEHYSSEIELAAPQSTVYAALTTQQGIQNWWTKTCEVGPAIGSQVIVKFGTTFKVMRIESLLPDREVRWKVTEAHLDAPGLTRTDEWIGSTITFQLVRESDFVTRLSMEHRGLTPQVECYEICSNGWKQFLASLKSYVESGRGTPFVQPTQ